MKIESKKGERTMRLSGPEKARIASVIGIVREVADLTPSDCRAKSMATSAYTRLTWIMENADDLLASPAEATSETEKPPEVPT